MGFPPDIHNLADTNRCVGNYTVKAASCWKNYPWQSHAITCTPSQGEACCYGGYQVCWEYDQNGKAYRHIWWMNNNTLGSTCTDSCVSSCGAFQEDGIYNRRRPDDTPSLSSTQPAPATVAPTEAPSATKPRNGTNQKKQR